MHIKELVLDNFKSFGRTTHIPFYEDFTVITGPNGSGKSNIIDGVLFALGLARTRGIRAEKLTDLIYNPPDAEGAGPKEASVTVILDNGDATVDRSQVVNAAGSKNVGDTDEITIKRRVKETEDNYYSYYYLNGRSVNLSDIRDLLAQAGISPEGYNVVMQGDVTEIINMTPYRRREIIDEIAGVAEFDAKKESAFTELETVEERIDEADLRIDEKQDRLAQLEDERETALEYQEYRDERDDQEGYLRAAELEAKRSDLDGVEVKIEAAEQDLTDLQEELDRRQGTVTRLEAELEELNSEIERTGEDEQLKIKSRIEELKGDISRIEGRIEAEEETIQSAEADRRETFVAIDRKDERIEELSGEIRETKVEKASVKSEIATERGDLSRIQSEIDSIDTEYDELKQRLADRKEAVETERDKKNATQREKDRLLDEARRRSSTIEETQQALETAQEELPKISARVSELHSELDTAQKNVDKIDETIAELRAEKARRRGELDELEDDIRVKQTEYAQLEAQADRSGDTSWPRSVTTALNAGMEGVHGAVGELGAVDSEYATACETAAGGRLANVVVADDGVGQSCIDHLKQRNAGRATFLPMTEMDDRALPQKPRDPGVIDFARNLVEYDDTYAGIFSYVLGSTLVVDNTETARAYMGQYRMVTLDGDLVEKSGAMTGGSGGGSRYSFSKSGKGKIERIAEEIENLEDDRRALETEIADLEDEIEDARGRQSDATDRVRSLETDLERTENEAESQEARIETLETDLADLHEERDSVDAEMSELDASIDDRDERIAELNAEINEIEAELADSQIPELTDQADEVRAAITELDDRMDDLDAQLNELELEKEYAESDLEGLHETAESAQNQKAAAEEQIIELEAEISDTEDALEEKREAVAELEEELAELKAERETHRDELREAKSARNEQRDKTNAAESTVETRREEAERLAWEIDELEAEVGEYDPEKVPDHATVEQRIAELETEMEKLEPVNMLAIDEYDDVNEDLETLQERRDVLADERDGIADRIAEYDAQKKETFMDSFTAINEQFQDIFSRLSEGTGKLVLENPEDPFEEGMTMKAEPSDKPIQRLESMSGGEKSLTALAFIFAIQRHNPAPFYALDEVDAFLDAVNAERVGEMVDDLAGDAQFAVVSHRAALLERSERALGVTMQDDNVSAVTGIKFDGLVPGEDPEVSVGD